MFINQKFQDSRSRAMHIVSWILKPIKHRSRRQCNTLRLESCYFSYFHEVSKRIRNIKHYAFAHRFYYLSGKMMAKSIKIKPFKLLGMHYIER